MSNTQFRVTEYAEERIFFGLECQSFELDDYDRPSHHTYENNSEVAATCVLEDMVRHDHKKLSIEFWVPEELRTEHALLQEEFRQQDYSITDELSDVDTFLLPCSNDFADVMPIEEPQPPCGRIKPTKRPSLKKLKPIIRHHVEDSKNFLTNVGTQLKNYFERRFRNTATLDLFYDLFGRRKTYKSLKRFSNLFGSPLQEYCLDFIDHHAVRMITLSKTAKKPEMIKYLAVLRQGAVRGSITNLAPS